MKSMVQKGMLPSPLVGNIVGAGLAPAQNLTNLAQPLPFKEEARNQWSRRVCSLLPSWEKCWG